MPSSDDDDDLFGDDSDGGESDDTAELIANSKSPPKAAAAASKKKKPAPQKKKTTTTKKQPESSGGGGGLFDSDSDSDDSDDDGDKKKQAAAPKKQKVLSKRERLEALARRKKGAEQGGGGGDSGSGGNDKIPKKKNKDDKDSKEKSGYDSGDSYNSATFQRTQEDDDFIDTTGENPDDVRELYAEQNFHDERPDDDEDGKGKKGKKKKRKYRSYEAIEDKGGDAEPDNPIMAAVHRMKKKKRAKKLPSEIEDEIKDFLTRMDVAAEDDEKAVAERRPATQKLKMLNEVCDMLARKDMQRKLLDFDLLTIVRRWVQPLPGGKLGNVTVRQRLLESIGKMTGEDGVNNNDLKRSELGKIVMVLYKHRSETPNMKRQLKALVEQWSRPIFQKSGNMRDLERVHNIRGVESLAAVSRMAAASAPTNASSSPKKARIGKNQEDIQSMIAQGKSSKGSGGELSASVNRVRIPFSKGFDFSVRPTSRAAGPSMSADDDGRSNSKLPPGGNRDQLSKRMVEKGRKAGKNQRSANVSVEGRRTKG